MQLNHLTLLAVVTVATAATAFGSRTHAAYHGIGIPPQQGASCGLGCGGSRSGHKSTPSPHADGQETVPDGRGGTASGSDAALELIISFVRAQKWAHDEVDSVSGHDAVRDSGAHGDELGSMQHHRGCRNTTTSINFHQGLIGTKPTQVSRQEPRGRTQARLLWWFVMFAVPRGGGT